MVVELRKREKGRIEEREKILNSRIRMILGNNETEKKIISEETTSIKISERRENGRMREKKTGLIMKLATKKMKRKRKRN